jgi:hypothetical protein
MYYPKNKIKTDLYTNGGHLVYKESKKNYIGFYWEVEQNIFYSGRKPQDGLNLELELSSIKPVYDVNVSVVNENPLVIKYNNMIERKTKYHIMPKPYYIDISLINGEVNRRNKKDISQITSTAALCAQAVPFFVSDESGYNENGEKMYYDQDSIRDQARLALANYGSIDGLNASQKLAVEGAVTNRLTLIQGPPGTG